MSPNRMGRHNPRVSELRSALHQRELTPDGLLPVEGSRLIEELDESGIEILELFLREGAAPNAHAAHQHILAPSVFRSVAATENPQGVIALVRPPRFTLESILNTGPLTLMVLCRIQDPGNVGNIFRIGEAFEANGCVGIEGTVSFHNAKVVRASAGSLFRLPHVEDVNFKELTDRLKSVGIQILGTATDGEDGLTTVDWGRPTAILLGNEGGGLDSQERQACDRIVRIPHVRTVDSLNAATSAAIMLYEARRYRNPEAT